MHNAVWRNTSPFTIVELNRSRRVRQLFGNLIVLFTDSGSNMGRTLTKIKRQYSNRWTHKNICVKTVKPYAVKSEWFCCRRRSNIKIMAALSIILCKSINNWVWCPENLWVWELGTFGKTWKAFNSDELANEVYKLTAALCHYYIYVLWWTCWYWTSLWCV